jgi:hypothetical protein
VIKQRPIKGLKPLNKRSVLIKRDLPKKEEEIYEHSKDLTHIIKEEKESDLAEPDLF